MHCLKKVFRKKMSSKQRLKEEFSERDPLLRNERKSQSTISTSDFNEEVEPSSGGPDGFRAWVVASALLLITMLMSGQARVANILFLDFMRVFHINRKLASAPYSNKQAAKNLFGPLAGILGQKYGVRAVVMTGGIISSLSTASCYFVTDITWITFMWGTIGGLANGFTSSLNQVVIEKYFKVYKTSASGLAFSGACIGAVFFSGIIGNLVQNYELSGAFLILGGITTFVMPAAMLLIDPPWLQQSPKLQAENKDVRNAQNRKSDTEINEKQKPLNNVQGETSLTNTSSSENKNNFARVDFACLQKNSDLVYQLFVVAASEKGESYPEKKILLRELDYIFYRLQQSETEARNYIGEIQKRIQVYKQSHSLLSQSYMIKQNDETYDWDLNKHIELYIPIKLESVLEISQSFSNPKDVEVLHELKVLSQLFKENITEFKKYYTFNDITNVEKIVDNSENRNTESSNTFLTHIKTSIKLHGNPLFLLVCLCRGIYMLTFTPVLTAGVDFAVDKGLSPKHGIYVVGALSVGDFIGRLCTGWITDRGYLSLEKYMMVVMIIQGISTATLPFFRGETLLIAMTIFALLEGSLFVRQPVAVAKYLRSHEKSIGVGFINLPSGILGFLLPYYIGYFRDHLGSYDIMFYINGTLSIMAGFIWLFEPCLLRYLQDKNSNLDNIGR